jgi:hypothetical protein
MPPRSLPSVPSSTANEIRFGNTRESPSSLTRPAPRPLWQRPGLAALLGGAQLLKGRGVKLETNRVATLDRSARSARARGSLRASIPLTALESSANKMRILIAKILRVEQCSNVANTGTYEFLIANPARIRVLSENRERGTALSEQDESPPRIPSKLVARSRRDCAKLVGFFLQERLALV